LNFYRTQKLFECVAGEHFQNLKGSIFGPAWFLKSICSIEKKKLLTYFFSNKKGRIYLTVSQRL